MKLKRRLTFMILPWLLMSLFLSSCLPGSGGGSSSGGASCEQGFVFDSVKRACLATGKSNDPPVATTKSASITENAGTTNVTLDYTDFDGDPALGCTIITFSNGIDDTAPTCTCIGGICRAAITPDTNFSGLADFRYTISDNDGASAQVLVAVTIIDVNNTPVASNGNVIATEGSPQTFDFSTLAIDPDGDIPSITILTPTTSLGSISPTSGDANTTFTFTPNTGVSDDNLLGEGVLSGMRYVIDPDFNSSSASMTVSYIPGGSLAIGTVATNLLTVFVVDGVTTDAEVKALLDGTPGIDTTVGIQYEILGSKPISLGGSTQTLTLNNGLDMPDSFTYRATDAQNSSLTADGTMNVNVTNTASTPVPDPSNSLAVPVTILEDNLSQAVSLPYADTDDHFIDLASQGLSFTMVSESNGVITDCMGRAGSEAALAGIHDINCTFNISANASSDDANASVEVGVGGGSLRYRALNPGVAGDSLSVQYTDSSGVGSVSVSGVTAGTITNIQVTYDSAVHTTRDIKTAVDAAITAAGRPKTPTANDDFEVIMLGSALETATGTFNFTGGRDFAATFQYQVNGLASQTQTVNFDITPSSDVPEWPGVPSPGIPANQNLAAVEDTNLSFTAGIGVDPDKRDNLSYVIDETGLQGDIKNCMGEDGSDSADLSCDFVPAQDFAGVTTFSYKVSDGTNQSSSGTVVFTVAATQDPPILCDYYHFNEAPECGELGCIANSTPINNITPSKDGIVYYDMAAAACYISDTSLADKWRALNPATAGDQSLFIPTQTVNEKEQIVIDQIRIDEGGNPSEDAEVIQFTALTSSNAILIPTNNIKFFYNGVDITAGLPFGLGDAGASADANEFRLEITPVGGQVGTSTITLTFEDNTVPTPLSSTVTFDVVVNPVSAGHGGWSNLSAVGPKVNKFGQNKNIVYACSYNRSLCNGECIGTTTPLNNVTPTKTNVLYYDSAANKCYHLPQSATPDAANWVEIQTVCQVSPSIIETGCNSLDGSCIGSTDPNGVVTAAKANSQYYDRIANKCYRSTAASSTVWQEYVATGEVELDWETFSVSGSGSISGYNVYRRLGIIGESFDYHAPINKTLIPATTTAYTDNAVNSYEAPLPQTVYLYEVRPVINNIATNTTEGFKTARIMIPPNNKTFVHRWMVNQNICSLMQAGDTDPLNNYRCSYEGPGDTQAAAGSNYYDIGNDLIVDRYEAGCAYSSSACDTADGSCLGIGDPNTVVTAVLGTIFYDRGSGKCYRGNGGTSWTELDSAASIIANYNVAELPPLVHMKQATADAFCRNASFNLTDSDIMGLQLATTLSSQLPSRKMQIAYSQWSSTIDDTTIDSHEQGLSLNVSSRCNSSSASGLTSSYTDSTTPSSNDLFSLPGTATSGIRSMMTGHGALGNSQGTETCSSRYRVQDAVGNVKEWVAERLYCGYTTAGQEFSCQAMISADVGAGEPWAAQVTALPSITNDARPGLGADDYNVFRLDGIIGPCNGTGGNCDDSLTNWVIEQTSFSSRRWVIPMGIPAHTDFAFDFPSSVVGPHLKEIGTTSGITQNQLHNDKITFNNQLIRADENSCGSMAAGGSYLDGNGAGVWSFEYTQCGDANFGYLINDGIFYRAKNPNVSLRIEVASGASQPLLVTNNAGGGDANELVVFLATDASSNASTTAAELITALETDLDATTLVDVFVVGQVSSIPTTISKTPVNKTDPYSRRVDIGFRCVTQSPIQITPNKTDAFPF